MQPADGAIAGGKNYLYLLLIIMITLTPPPVTLQWAFFGECDKNPGYMLTGCKKSCKVCDPAHINTGRVIEVPITTE